MTDTAAAGESVDAALARLRRSGYRVASGEAARQLVPDWLQKFRLDFLAQRDNENLILEVKSRASASVSGRLDQLTQLAAEVNKHHGWALELLWLGDDEPLVTARDVDELIARAERVVSVSSALEN